MKRRLQEISASLPADVKAQVISDQSVFIKAAVDSIKHHLVEGSFQQGVEAVRRGARQAMV